jgi:hypothetical protein
MFAFQSLHPAQFIIADNPLALSSQFNRPLIQVINIGILGLKRIIVLIGQPVTDPMRFEISLFLKDVRRGGLKSAR